MIRFRSYDEERAWIAFAAGAIADPAVFDEGAAITADAMLERYRVRTAAGAPVEHAPAASVPAKDEDTCGTCGDVPCEHFRQMVDQLDAELAEERLCHKKSLEALTVLQARIESLLKRQPIWVLVGQDGRPLAVAFERRQVEILADAGVHRIVRATIDPEAST